MNAKGICPILNISDFEQTIEWFKKFGWKKNWEWGEPATFGCVSSGEVEIFICLNGQGGRGKGQNTATFSQEAGETRDKGVWLSIWVEDVDRILAHCQKEGIEIMHEPEDMPWNVRELHIRHPDGHVFRISQGLECE